MEPIKKKDLEELFAAIDAKLTLQINIFVIGGASAILGYNIQKVTEDVDLDTGVDPQLNELFDHEAKRLGLEIYLSHKGVFYPPDNYRERMKFLDFPKKKLRVWFLDKYDLAISKIDRGFQKDFDDIVAVHSRSTYDLKELIRIFNEEYIKVAAIGNPREKMMNLLDLIDKLFGAEAMENSKASIGFT